MSRAGKPAWATVDFDGHPHRVHLAEIDRAWFRCIVEGKFTTRDDMAEKVGYSRSTVSRFFAGGRVGIRVATLILGELGVKFDEVAVPQEREELLQ